MRCDNRLSGVLHVLLHMMAREQPTTSEDLARALDTNPVVIRRIMAGLRERGYVTSGKGHGGGWALGRNPADLTLRDIYEALGRPAIFAIGNRNEAPDCLVEQVVNEALDRQLRDAEAMLLARFAEIDLATLASGIREKRGVCRDAHTLEHAHGD